MDVCNRIAQKRRELSKQFSWYEKLISKEPKNTFQAVNKDQISNALQDLPLMTEQSLEPYYCTLLEDPSLSVYHTSGTSSGKRKKIYYSAEDDQHYIELKAKIFEQFIAGESITSALADMGTGHAAHTAVQVFRQMGLKASAVSFQAPIEVHIAKLKKHKPNLLYTMPSILERILLASENPRQYGIKKIILVGEIASRQWLAQVAQAFQLSITDIMDTYGSIEVGTIAYYSHPQQRYLIVEDMIAEGLAADQLDLQLEPLHALESILVLTSFQRKLFPALRWVTYDVVRDLRTIMVDGVERQSFESIVKRVGHELKHGEKISLYDMEEIVYRHLQEASMRVEVQENKMKLKIYSPELNAPLQKLIQQEITEKIPEINQMIQNGILAQIEVEIVLNLGEMSQGSVKNKKLYYSATSKKENQ